MKILVNPHKVEVRQDDIINEKEINVTNCTFEFSEEYTNDLVKEAIFTQNGKSYKEIVANDKCDIPYEVLENKGEIEIGLVAYEVEDDEYVKRFNPTPTYITTFVGSLKSKYENSQPITPSEMEQFEQELNDGLQEVANVDIDAEKVGSVSTVTITNRNGVSKSVEILDGEKGDKGDKGDTGATGPAGKDGKDGQDGKDGKDGVNGTNGTDGRDGVDGKDAKINGVNTASIVAGDNITINQQGSTLIISSTASGTTYTAGDNISISEQNVISAIVPTVPTNVSAFTNDAGYLTQHQDISGKLDTSAVKTTTNTTQGNVYDVTYINTMLGDIESLLGGI